MASQDEDFKASELVHSTEAVVRAEFVRALHNIDPSKYLDLSARAESRPAYDLSEFSVPLFAQCTLAGTVLAQAFHNRVVIEDLDAVRYAQALAETRDGARDGAAAELAAFGCASTPVKTLIVAPTLFVDRFGVVVGCYLPHVLLPVLQAEIREALNGIHRQFREKKPLAPGQKGSWRRKAEYFRLPQGESLPLGAPVFAPALFPTGRSPLRGHLPMISGSLTTSNAESGLEFLWKAQVLNAITTAIVSIIHPHQHKQGMDVHEYLVSQKTFGEVMKYWPSTYSGFQIINNRVSPPHRDCGAPYSALDALTAIGEYSGGHIRLCNGPFEFLQPPGSVLALSSRIFEHEVTAYEGNRISFAWFVKDTVYQWAKQPQIPWSLESTLLDEFRES